MLHGLDGKHGAAGPVSTWAAAAKPGDQIALLEVDKVVFQARAGQYIGQNFGFITQITDSSVTLKEIIQDGTGDWSDVVE